MSIAPRMFETLEARNLLSATLPQVAVDGETLRLPGDETQLVTVEATWITKQAEYANEVGLIRVADSSGTAGALAPTSPGYGVSALSSSARELVFASGDGVGAQQALTLPGGTSLVPYLIANASSEEYLSALQSGEALRERDAFFSTVGANVDGFSHFRFVNTEDGVLSVAAEDIRGGGDQDFTDVVATFEVISIADAPKTETIEIVSAPTGVTLDGEAGTLDLSQLEPGTHTIVVSVGGEIEPELPQGTPLPGLGETIINETFDGGQFTADWTEVYSTDGRGEIVQLADGDYAYEFQYQRDEESFKLQQYPIDFDSVYVRIEETFPDGLEIPGAIKQSRIFDVSPVGGEYMNLQIWGNGRQDTNFSPMDTAVYYDFPVAAGETIVTEYYFAWNDPGQSNGEYYLKRNGETLVAFDDLYFADDQPAAGVWVGGNISLRGIDPEPLRRQMRSIEIIANPVGAVAELPLGNYDFSVIGDFRP